MKKVQIRENTDQKKLRIWTIFPQCRLSVIYLKWKEISEEVDDDEDRSN